MVILIFSEGVQYVLCRQSIFVWDLQHADLYCLRILFGLISYISFPYGLESVSVCVFLLYFCARICIFVCLHICLCVRVSVCVSLCTCVRDVRISVIITIYHLNMRGKFATHAGAVHYSPWPYFYTRKKLSIHNTSLPSAV